MDAYGLRVLPDLPLILGMSRLKGSVSMERL